MPYQNKGIFSKKHRGNLSISHLGQIPINKMKLPRKKLRNLYINHKLTSVKIAKIFNCSYQTVLRNLKDYDIQINSVSKGTVNGMLDKKIRIKISQANKGKHRSPTTEFKKGCISLNKGVSLTDAQKLNLRIKNLGKKQSQKTIRKRVKSTVSHHIYLKENSNKTMQISFSKHTKLHHRAYDYLVEIGLINNYIKWFDKKYGLK